MKLDLEKFIENSLNETSNLENLLNQYPIKLNESNSTTNIEGYSALLTKLISRVQEEIKYEDFCSVLDPITSSGKVPYLSSKQTGKDSQGASIEDDIKVFIVDDSSSFTEGGDISSSTATGLILHVELNKILVKTLSGTFVPSDSIDNAIPFVSQETSIEKIYSSIHSVGAILENYSGDYSTETGESLTDYPSIEFKFDLVDINCTSKFIKSDFSKEFLSDMYRSYGVRFNSKLINSLTKIIKDFERQRIWSFQRANAYLRPDIVLTDSYGVNGGISKIYGDLYSRINASIGSIGTNTGISGEYSVICSSNVFAGISTFLKGSIRYANGKHIMPNKALLIEDGYSYRDYLMVILRGPNENGSVLYSPYSMNVISAQDGTDFSEKVKVMVRSDLINSPLATKENDQSKNEMIELTNVDMTSLTNQF